MWLNLTQAQCVQHVYYACVCAAHALKSRHYSKCTFISLPKRTALLKINENVCFGVTRTIFYNRISKKNTAKQYFSHKSSIEIISIL